MHKNIKLLLACSVLIHSAGNLFAPIYAVYVEKIGGTLADAGIAVGIYAILRGVLYFLWAKIPEDKLSKKTMMACGYLLFCCGYILYIFAATPYHIFGIQGLLAIAETIITPSWSAIIAVSLKEGKEVHIYSHFYGYRSLFEGVAAIIGGIFAVKMGFAMVFYTMAIFALVAAILSLFVDEELFVNRQ